MGLKLNVDLESHLGPTQEAYVEIDSIKLSRVNGSLRFSTTFWLNESVSKEFYRSSIESNRSNAQGMLSNKLLYFSDEKSDGVEITLENHFNIPFTRLSEIEVPVIKKFEVEEKIPYTSFDENGDEVIKYRVEKRIKNKQIGTEKQKRNFFDYSTFSDPLSFIQEVLINEYSNVLPKDKLETV